MKVKLLREIAKVIQEKPKEFAMDYLHSDKNGEPVIFQSSKECGTAHCIAGWAAILTGKGLGNGSFGREIGVSPEAENRLIFVHNWPARFALRYDKAKTRRTRAEVAVERIEHFIATRGKE